MQTWSSDQLKTFIESAAHSRLRYAFTILATTGMRRGEALGLRWSDVDFDSSQIAIVQTVSMIDGKIVIDTNNYYPQRDGQIAELDTEATTSAELLQAHLPTSKVVKAFNHITSADLGTHGSPSGTPQTAVPTPTDLIGRWADDGRAVFTWANPDPRTGDRYLWGVAVAGSETGLAVEVAIVRADRRASTVSAVGCTS